MAVELTQLVPSARRMVPVVVAIPGYVAVVFTMFVPLDVNNVPLVPAVAG